MTSKPVLAVKVGGRSWPSLSVRVWEDVSRDVMEKIVIAAVGVAAPVVGSLGARCVKRVRSLFEVCRTFLETAAWEGDVEETVRVRVARSAGREMVEWPVTEIVRGGSIFLSFCFFWKRKSFFKLLVRTKTGGWKD